MVRRQKKPVVSNYVKPPPEILVIHRMVSVAEDVIFVNWMGFLVSIPRNIKFTTVQYVVRRMMVILSKYLKNINEV